ncbi:hypothetical protein BH09ACT10_BH09ACT10_27660 [soil metagenome]
MTWSEKSTLGGRRQHSRETRSSQRLEFTFGVDFALAIPDEIAGVEHRVRAIDPTAPGSDIGTVKQFADRVVASPLVDCSETTKALGITPTPLADGVRATVDWFRSEGLI